MNEDYAEMVELSDAGVPLKQWPEDLRLIVLRIRWLGVDVSSGIARDDFEMCWGAMRNPAIRYDEVWRAEAEAGLVNAAIAYHEALTEGWKAAVRCWDRGEPAPPDLSDVEAALWPIVDARPELDGTPTLGTWGEAWRSARGREPLIVDIPG